MPNSKAIIIVAALSFTALLLTLARTFWSESSYRSFGSRFQSPLKSPVETQVTNWTDFAYVQYVTNVPYLCNSVMLFESLHRLGSQADRLLMYPEEMDLSETSVEGQLLGKARDQYNAVLQPIEVQKRPSADCRSIWPPLVIDAKE